MRELLSLTCVHNANLSRSEFTNVQSSAMHWQDATNSEEERATRVLDGILLGHGLRGGPPTATGAFSRISDIQIGRAEASEQGAPQNDGNHPPEERVPIVDISTTGQQTQSATILAVQLSINAMLDHLQRAFDNL